MSNLTLGNLRNVLTSLSCSQENPNVETQLLPTSSESSSESIGKQPIFEYGSMRLVYGIKMALTSLRWYLGVVDEMNNGEVLVSSIKMSDKKGPKWLFPDETFKFSLIKM